MIFGIIYLLLTGRPIPYYNDVTVKRLTLQRHRTQSERVSDNIL